MYIYIYIYIYRERERERETERENQESWYIINFKAEGLRSGRRGEEF